MPDLGCSTNAAVAFDYLIGKGLRDYQAAAVVGNLQFESRLDPTLAIMDTNGLPSRGIAMWQPQRWQNLLTFSAGRNPLSINTQLEFLWNELPSAGLAPLTASSSLEDAVVIFQDQFEKPRADLAHTDRRIALAQAALYACPSVRTPTSAPRSRVTTFLLSAAAGALVAATGYGIYRALGTGGYSSPDDVPYAFRRRGP